MAATPRSELYHGLIRRIGYSVGLEFLIERVGDLVDRYVLQGSIDGADWRDLVKQWRREETAEQHIADVYAQLDLLHRYNGAIQILPTLDVLSILIRGSNPLLGDGKSADSGEILRFVLMAKILEADGDIFLNALASDFRQRDLGVRLQWLIRHKRSMISPFFKQAGSIRRIREAVSIRNQSDSTGKGKKLTYAQRSRLLMTGGGQGVQLPVNWYNEEVAISEDYLEKTCVTRGGWAEELGLYRRREGLVTSDGVRLLGEARSLGLEIESPSEHPTFAFWPYGFQLRRMSLAPEDIRVPDLNPWDLLRAIAGTFATEGLARQSNDAISPDRNTWFLLLECTLKLYRSASRRGMIRHDLPLFIAEAVLAFWLSEITSTLPNFRAFLRDEIRRPDRLVDLVMIHGTEGGLRVMREKGGASGD